MPHQTVETSRLEPQSISTMPLAELHGERLPHFLETPFPRLFERQVAVQPEAMALLCEDEQLTFGELNARANQLARQLQNLGVATESIVGICIDRSVEMAIAIIATLKAGAAYLPLDPEYPQERLAFMLKDASPTVVLTKSGLAAKLRFSTSPTSEGATRWLALDENWTEIAQNSNENLFTAPARDDLAYVIYTSGSTGQPKGAMITHSGLANYLRALNRELEIDSHDLYLHTASIA
ncbi:MAG TPA: AMP-binding protein, partial [Pyrinomonadaceae bacterium]|nr:AMP-binding protein [Pyrinomonadaceae bacterium]